MHPPPFRPGAVRADVVLSLQALGLQRLVIGAFDRNPMVVRERIDPPLVLLRPLPQGLFRDRIDPVDVQKKWTMCSSRVKSGR
jgi:hypothetical protein